MQIQQLISRELTAPRRAGARTRGARPRTSLAFPFKLLNQAFVAISLTALFASYAAAQQLPPPQNPAPLQNAVPLPPQTSAPAEPSNASQPPLQNPILLPPQNGPAQQPANAANANAGAANAPAANAAAAPNAAAQNPAGAKPKGKPPEFFRARYQAQIARREAAKQRMRQFQDARAAAEEKLYQDWHERYLADTPVRVEYARALAADSEANLFYRTPSFYAAGPPIIYPAIFPAFPVCTPIYQNPVYGTFFWWGW